jgi:hypothetical protein
LIFKEGIKNFSEAKCTHGKEPFIPGKARRCRY